MKRALLFMASSFAVVSTGFAQVSQVGQFAGALNDNFDSYVGGAAGPSFTFLGGLATNDSDSSSSIWLSGNHGLGGSKAIYASSQAMVANSNGLSPWTITFASGVSEFGGMWQSAYDDSTLSFTFYDTSDVELNTIVVTPPNSGDLTWYGFGYGAGIGKVLVTSSQPYQIVDDFTANPVPEPATMAVLGLGAAALLRRRRK